MADNRDYYDILGVKKTASTDEIRKAYRDLARKLHPDVNKEENAAAKFGAVQEAYDTLSDDEKRKAYDRFGRLGGRGGFGGAGGARSGRTSGAGRQTYESGGFGGFGRGGGGETFTGPDLQTILEEMMGGGGGRTAWTARAPQPTKGNNLQHTLDITFDTAVKGGKESIQLSGVGGGTQTVDVTIPKGTEPGAKLRVKGKGQPSPNGGPRGDLILTIHVGKHPYFERDGLNVLLDLPLTIAEATLGTKVEVPLLFGTVDIHIPPGTASGKRIRVKNKGIENAKGERGHFYAITQIVPPKADSLSDNGRAAITELAKELENPRKSVAWADRV